MYFAELQKKAEEILQSLGNKLSAINSPEPLLRPVPPYISDVITAMELLENKKYVLNIGKRTFNCVSRVKHNLEQQQKKETFIPR